MAIPTLRYYTDLIRIIDDSLTLHRAEECYRSHIQHCYYEPSNPFHFFESKRNALWYVAGMLHRNNWINTKLLCKIRLSFFLIYLIDIIIFIIKTPSFRLSYLAKNQSDYAEDTIEFINSGVVIKTATEYMDVSSSKILSSDQRTSLSLVRKVKILLLALRYRSAAFRAIAQYLIIRDEWLSLASILKDKHLIGIEGVSYQDYFHIWFARKHRLKTSVVVPFIYTIPYAYHVSSVVLPSDTIEDEFAILNDDIMVKEASITSANSDIDPTKKIGLGFGSNSLNSDQQTINVINDIILSSSRNTDTWYLSLHPQIRFSKPRLMTFQAQIPKGVKIRQHETNKAFLEEIDIIVIERSTLVEEALQANKFIIILTNGTLRPAEEKLSTKFPSKLWYCPDITSVKQALDHLLGNINAKEGI